MAAGEEDIFVDEEMEPDPELNRITNDILGAAIEVHRTLGPGFPESVYANALAMEFRLRGIPFQQEVWIDVVYKGEVVGRGRMDFLVEEKVIVELKAVEQMVPLYANQAVSDLKATHQKLALLLNFNVRRLKDDIRRVAN
ncbi:MAG TPA: GxxExxY protein [Tepidisphaeraceae bacterium]